MRASVLLLLTACAGAAQPPVAPGLHLVRVYGAPVVYGEYGAIIDDPLCPVNALGLDLDDRLKKTRLGRKFWTVLLGGGKIVGAKYAVISGDVEVAGDLATDRRVNLVRVRSVSEQAYDPVAWGKALDELHGCEKDAAHRAAWVRSITTPPGR